jgi:nucleoside-diphosphate-sugar epimerase
VTGVTRVLVTGASGGFGSSLLERLAARDGVEAVAFDLRPPIRPQPGVTYRSGDIRDGDAVADAMRGCDVVVHLAWVVEPSKDRPRTEAIDLGGTRNVLAAMRVTDCGRLVFASSVTAYGASPDHPRPYREDDALDPDPAFAYAWHKAAAERLIAEAGVPAVVVRAAIVIGARVDNAVRQVFAAPVLAAIRGDDMKFQAVHQDDVGRFYAEACLGERTGTVNLAADDVLGIDEVGARLGKRVVRLPEAAVAAFVRSTWTLGLARLDPGGFAAMRWLPIADTTRLREEWGYRCEHTTASGLDDFRAALAGRVALGRFELKVPGRGVNRGR